MEFVSFWVKWKEAWMWMTHMKANSCECENVKFTHLLVSFVPHKIKCVYTNQAKAVVFKSPYFCRWIYYHITSQNNLTLSVWWITLILYLFLLSEAPCFLTCAAMRWGRQSCTGGRSPQDRAGLRGSGPSWQAGGGTSAWTYGSSWCCRW